MKEFDCYKTNLGLFIKNTGNHYSYHEAKINGIAKEEFPVINGWMFLKDIHEITSYEDLKAGENKQTGWVLKISTIASEEIPLELSVEAVGAYYDNDSEETVWKNYAGLQSLYKPVYVKLEDRWVSEQIKLNILRELQIDSFENPVKMNVVVKLLESRCSNDLASIVHYDDFERVLTPEFLLHERPCKLSSQQVYSIVRHHVKSNINPATAHITSDYDFCFTVKRKVAIKPYINKVEIKKNNGKSYATPKYRTSSVQHKDVELFEMTHAGSNYRGYTVISGWEAANLKEMKEQVEIYLNSLMNEINKSVIECEHCGGVGYIVNIIKTNERNL